MGKKEIHTKGGEQMVFESTKVILMIPPEKRKEEIEKIAWQYFQDKLRISFKSSITEDQIKEITNRVDYQEYRDYAETLMKKGY